MLRSVVRTSLSASLTALLLSLPAAGARAQAQPAVRTDSVLLARDLDGDGKTDYVVAESKRGSDEDVRPARVAVYLGARPGTVRAAWATAWDDYLGSDADVTKTMRLDSSATFVLLQSAEGDYEQTWLLLVQGGRAIELLSHGIDYGNGFFELRRDAGQIVVEATQEHLESGHRPLGKEIQCRGSGWPATRLAYDRALARFVVGETRCVPPTSVREP